MSVQLTKGQKVSLTKESNTKLSRLIVGLGWAESKEAGENFDCDAFAILVGEDEKMVNSNDVVYFGALKHSSGAVEHLGDNLVGGGGGDDEQIVIDLEKIPDLYKKIIIGVNIYNAKAKGYHFGMIDNAHIHLIDDVSKKELCIYNLTDSYSGMTALLFGEIYRGDGEWKFNAIGQGTTDGSVSEFATRYGMQTVPSGSSQYSYSGSNNSSSSGGCYIATAVYGSYDTPEVWTLRRYRDYTLAENFFGRQFIRTYYAISPTLVRIFGNQQWFKRSWKKFLDEKVKKLNQKGVDNTPYSDRKW